MGGGRLGGIHNGRAFAFHDRGRHRFGHVRPFSGYGYGYDDDCWNSPYYDYTQSYYCY
jgi:hypothetical protein